MVRSEKMVGLILKGRLCYLFENQTSVQLNKGISLCPYHQKLKVTWTDPDVNLSLLSIIEKSHSDWNTIIRTIKNRSSEQRD